MRRRRRRGPWDVADVFTGVLLALGLHAAVLLGVVVADGLRTSYDLRDDGVRTTGVVVATRTERHREHDPGDGLPAYTTYHYATVAYERETGREVVEIGGEYRTGDTVPIVYDRDSPAVAGHAAETSERALWWRWGLLAVLAAGVVAGLVRLVRLVLYG